MAASQNESSSFAMARWELFQDWALRWTLPESWSFPLLGHQVCIFLSLTLAFDNILGGPINNAFIVWNGHLELHSSGVTQLVWCPAVWLHYHEISVASEDVLRELCFALSQAAFSFTPQPRSVAVRDTVFTAWRTKHFPGLPPPGVDVLMEQRKSLCSPPSFGDCACF